MSMVQPDTLKAYIAWIILSTFATNPLVNNLSTFDIPVLKLTPFVVKSWFSSLSLPQIVMAKLMDQGPVLVLTFQAQQLTVRKSGEKEEPDNVSAGLPATCYSNSFVPRLSMGGE